MTSSFTRPVFRFAPSPNGYLHLGHAYSALLNYEMARATDGRFLLRIENIDLTRCRPEFEQAIYEDLSWLGIAWEKPVRRQSDHFPDYAAALNALAARNLIYPCFCSRSDILNAVAERPGWPRDPDGTPLYPGTCKRLLAVERDLRLAAGEQAAWRIDLAQALTQAGDELSWSEFGNGTEARDVHAEPQLWGDALLARKDIPASYHIAVVVDDAVQGVTNVVRGEDLFKATSVHRLLQALLGLPTPFYHHHKLLRDASGQKLAKSLRAKSLRSLRDEGQTPAQVRDHLGFSKPLSYAAVKA
jgi:glutamyl-Q tRNA(Asp) synthetase